MTTHAQDTHDARFGSDRFGVSDRLFHHQRDQGGTLCEASGIQGSGKTTWLLNAACLLVSRGETGIWRGRDLDAWHTFPGTVKVWANHPIQIFKVPHDNDADAPMEPFHEVPVHRFMDAEDLVLRAEKGVLNVVYAKEMADMKDAKGRSVEVKTRFWDDMTQALAHKATTRWHSLFIDELHEVWGDHPQDEDWHAQRLVRNRLADFRKSFNSLFTATHHYDECDEAILKKFQFHAYLRGARIPGWSTIRNKQLAQHLAAGQALIVNGGTFCKLHYSRTPRPAYQVRVLAAPIDLSELWAKESPPEDQPETPRALCANEASILRGLGLDEAEFSTGGPRRREACGCTHWRSQGKLMLDPCADPACVLHRFLAREAANLGLHVVKARRSLPIVEPLVRLVPKKPCARHPSQPERGCPECRTNHGLGASNDEP